MMRGGRLNLGARPFSASFADCMAAARGLGYVGVKMRNQQENTGEGRVF